MTNQLNLKPKFETFIFESQFCKLLQINEILIALKVSLKDRFSYWFMEGVRSQTVFAFYTSSKSVTEFFVLQAY